MIEQPLAQGPANALRALTGRLSRTSNRARAACAAVGLTMLVLLAGACAEPVLPVAASAAGPPTPEPTPTPTVTATPTLEPTPVPTVIGAVPAVAAPTVVPAPAVIVPGLTETTMRIGVIADIETSGVADGLSLGAWEAAQAWATAVNDAGGIAGRTIELLLADSQLFAHEQAVEWVCANDVFALVGSKAVDDGAGVELLTSNACGLPDFPAQALMSQRRDSPVTYMSNPYPNPFFQAGPYRWLAREYPDAIERSAVLVLSLPSIRVETELMREAAGAEGFSFVYEPLIPLEEDFSIHAGVMADGDVRSLVWTADPGTLINFLAAWDGSGNDPFEFVLCGPDCYSTDFLIEADGLAEGVSVWIPHLPFSEPSESPEMVNYLYALNTAVPGAAPSSQGLAAWAAGRLFEQAASLAVGAGTPAFDPDALTRDSLLAAVQTVDLWTAFGVYGGTGDSPSPANGVPSPCFVLMRVEDGNWERQHPLNAGTMDCNKENRASLLSGAGLGLVAPDPTPTPEGADEDQITTNPLDAEDEVPEN